MAQFWKATSTVENCKVRARRNGAMASSMKECGKMEPRTKKEEWYTQMGHTTWEASKIRNVRELVKCTMRRVSSSTQVNGLMTSDRGKEHSKRTEKPTKATSIRISVKEEGRSSTQMERDLTESSRKE